MPGRLAGKIALISGGATGMGGASSKLFAAEGAKVGVVDRNEEAGHAVVAEIEAAGGTAMFAFADVANEGAVNAAVAAVTAALGAPNVLFNHAGSIIIKPFLETTLADWEWLMAVNVTSMFLVTKAVLPGMIAAGGGSIICTSSISAVAAMAEIEEVQTIEPPPAAIMPGSTALVIRNMLVTLTAISQSHSARVVSRKGLMMIEPA